MKKVLIGLVLTIMLFVSGGCSLSNKEDKNEGILGVYKFDRVDIMHAHLPGFVDKTTTCSISDVTSDSLLEEICYTDGEFKEFEIELKENYEAILTISIEGFDEYKAKGTYEVTGAGVLKIAVRYNTQVTNAIIRGNEILFADVIEGEDQPCEQAEGEGSTGSSCVIPGKDITYYYDYKKA